MRNESFVPPPLASLLFALAMGWVTYEFRQNAARLAIGLPAADALPAEEPRSDRSIF